MKYLLQIALLLAPIICTGEVGELAHPKQPDTHINLDSPDIIKDLGNGKLKIWIIEKGTRSEGLHGELEGMEDPRATTKSLTTSSGTFVFRGDWEDRPYLWAASGWLPEDLKAPLLKEEIIEYPHGSIWLANEVENTLKRIIEEQDKRLNALAEHSLEYGLSLETDIIKFYLVEHSDLTSKTYTVYEIRFPDRSAKYENLNERSTLTIRSFTRSEGTKIEELDLLKYRRDQIAQRITVRTER